jgi:hypothetical protein
MTAWLWEMQWERNGTERRWPPQATSSVPAFAWRDNVNDSTAANIVPVWAKIPVLDISNALLPRALLKSLHLLCQIIPYVTFQYPFAFMFLKF